MAGFKKELTQNILPFWMDKMQDVENGGFYGCIDGNNELHKKANKGCVLNARILWTFSAAYRILQKEEYLTMATRAYHYIKEYFIDYDFGGLYWELDYKGNPVNTKKQVYAQGFALYGFSEYHRATGDREALDLAIGLFHLIEKYKDKEHGGYFEAFTREWQTIEDMRLSDKDANEKKSMNTHLHILEPYTNLLRVWDNEELRTAQRELIDIFLDNILDHKTYYQNLFFGEDWTAKSSAISYGHDIEASWLLYEAADILGDRPLLNKTKSLSLTIANAAAEGLEADGSMIYEKDGQHTDKERHWWVQAEAVVGFMYAYKNTKNIIYKEKATRLWQYIQNQIVDTEHGEWIWSRNEDGAINHIDDKAGFWKCPYHNSRMCMEMIENFNLK
ncbi:AGE family epimerase/isomerase [Dysgonomonas sp. 25]|uniref:AGE family epimerase/isomerase n=1 Tax=Dysgonomonas sp. 25 TaxID=2302933 RepID=UPI0013D1CB77|nr:AGE family epimerase/isomerase [Dysgonomonas sp. 25]NDV68139.1 N-acyl-D-glucosamine 2-epimerase [Dysgonomonas sp. 25]